MRSLHHRQRRRALALTPPLVALTALCGLLSAPSYAQDLFVTSDATIAGGNPVNGDFSKVTVGADINLNPFIGVTADITGGNITLTVSARNASIVNISGGVIGAIPGGISYTALFIVQGSTLNLSGGTVRSFAQVGNFSSNDGTLSTFNMSGGSAPQINNGYGAIINITGGTLKGLPNGGARNYVNNTGDGTVNITGGTLDLVTAYGYDGGVINFGGTATADNLDLSTYYGNSVGNVTGGTVGAVAVGDSGVANISGGSVGAVGGFTVSGFGVVNFTGSGLTASVTGTRGVFDENYYQNFIVTDYAVAGTLSDGATLNATLSAGGDYSNDGSNATFNGYGASVAPDLFVQTDQTVSGTYNNVNIGIDETFSTKSSPTVTIADGNDTVEFAAYGGSVTNITGGIVRDFVIASDQSKVIISGGEIDGGISADSDSAVTMSGGAYYGYGISLSGNGSFTVQGSGLASDGTTGHYFDGYTNYTSAGNFHVTGTLADGNAFDQTIIAGGASGDASQQTLIAPTVAPDLHLTQNASVNALQNLVEIGRSADGSINSSPTVAFNDGADIAQVYVRNDSVLDVLGGVVRGTVSVGGDAEANISGGTLASVRQNNPGNGKMTVSGGSIAYLVPRNALTITGGDITTVDTYSGARVNIFGGNIMNVWGYGPDGSINILGGSVSNIIGYGQPFNLHGGNIGSGSIINLYGSPFDLFGMGFSITNGVAGTANGRNGVWWDVTGTLQSGQEINTRYFEANGSLSGPTHITTTAAAPEPGTLALMGVGCWVFYASRKKGNRAVQRRKAA